jgi:GT2 family glycosyltransferase
MNGGNKKKIAAVVVTYNRKHLLYECLDSLLNQTHPLDAIYIIDNASTDGTTDFLMEKGFIERLVYPDKDAIGVVKSITTSLGGTAEMHYVRMTDNIGGAGGFYEGVKRSYEAGFDWIWLMDDDSEAEKNCLSNLLEYGQYNITCPVIKDVNNGYQISHHALMNRKSFKFFPAFTQPEKKTYHIDINAFVGPLIKAEAVEKYGLPNKEYFIWVDDTEYTYRLGGKHQQMILNTEAVIFHKDERLVSGEVNTNALWKIYYGMRNTINFVKLHSTNKLYTYLFMAKCFFKAIKRTIEYLRYFRDRRFLVPFIGWMHGVLNIQGKYIDPVKFKNFKRNFDSYR